MKLNASRLIGGFGIGILLCGCASTGYKRAADTRSAIEDARDFTVRIEQEVDAAVLALTNMTNLATGDLRPQYQSFSAALDSLESKARRLPRHNDAVQRESEEYFRTWAKELNNFDNPSFRTQSAERRGKVIQSFQAIGQQFRAVEQSLRPLLLHLQDMHRYLGADLTAAGVASGNELTNRITNQAEKVRTDLSSLRAELDRLASELSPLIPAEAAAVK